MISTNRHTVQIWERIPHSRQITATQTLNVTADTVHDAARIAVAVRFGTAGVECYQQRYTQKSDRLIVEAIGQFVVFGDPTAQVPFCDATWDTPGVIGLAVVLTLPALEEEPRA